MKKNSIHKWRWLYSALALLTLVVIGISLIRFRNYEFVVAFLVILLIFGNIFYNKLMSEFIIHALETRKAIDDSAVVASIDLNGKITSVNNKFIKITGYAKEELLGQDYQLINSGAHSKEFFKNILTVASGGQVWRGDVKDVRRDGTHYWTDTSLIPMRDINGKTFQYMVIRYDITERKELEAHLIKSKNEAEDAAKVKSEFLANMSHEIRTPMNGIIGMSALLLSSTTDSVSLERLKIIQICGNTLLDLINDVLDFSKLEVDKVRLESCPLPLHKTVKDVMDLLNTRASEKGLILSYKFKPDVPDWVIGDVMRLRQILTNLISNSIKFTEFGSVQVLSEAQRLSENKFKIQFSIKDTGIGIPEDVRSKLFQSFSQVDASTTRKFGGSGLGLAISKGLCEKMGGSIWAESTLGKGSTFFFDFITEMSKPEEEKIYVNPFAQFDADMGKKHPLRILIAEDGRVNQLVAMGFLQKLGYTADIVVNGQEALECLKNKIYDLILMDCHMPIMDGFEATKKIISTYAEPDRPRIIALTASTMKKDIDNCNACGMNGVMAKPVTIAALVKTLGECNGRISNSQIPADAINPESLVLDIKQTDVVFDRETFLNNFQGLEDLVCETIHSFFTVLPGQMADIEAAISNKNSLDLELAAHTLKGTVSNFYAEPCKFLAWKLEQMGHGPMSNECDVVFKKLQIELKKLTKELQILANEKQVA